MDQRIEVEAHSIPRLRDEVGRLNPIHDRRGVDLFFESYRMGVERPGDDDVFRRLLFQYIFDVHGFCLQLEQRIRMCRKIGNEVCGSMGQMIQSKGVSQFSGPDAEGAISVFVQEIINLSVKIGCIRVDGDKGVV